MKLCSYCGREEKFDGQFLSCVNGDCEVSAAYTGLKLGVSR